MKTRNGTEVDEASLRETFTNLKYDVRVENDLTCDAIKKCLRSGKKAQKWINFINQFHIDLAIIDT